MIRCPYRLLAFVTLVATLAHAPVLHAEDTKDATAAKPATDAKTAADKKDAPKDDAAKKDAANEKRATPLPRYEMALELRGHTQLVRCVAFQPGTHVLASGGSDRALRIWNADKGLPIMEYILPRGG